MNTTFPFHRVRPLMLRVVIGSLIAAAAIAIFSIATGQFDDTSWRVLGTAALFAFFALLSWYDADVSAKRSARFALVSFAVSVYLFVAGIVKIWEPDDAYNLNSGFPGFGGWVLLAIIARVALLHTHLVLNTEARLASPVIAVVTKVTLVLVVMLAVLLSLPVLFSAVELNGPYGRTVGVIAVLDALGTVLIPLGYQMFTPARTRTAVPASTLTPLPGWQPPAAATTPTSPSGWRPPAAAYAKLGQPLLLAWPRYADGTDLPVNPTGNPDFTGVLGYDN